MEYTVVVFDNTHPSQPALYRPIRNVFKRFFKMPFTPATVKRTIAKTGLVKNSELWYLDSFRDVYTDSIGMRLYDFKVKEASADGLRGIITAKAEPSGKQAISAIERLSSTNPVFSIRGLDIDNKMDLAIAIEFE